MDRLRRDTIAAALALWALLFLGRSYVSAQSAPSLTVEPTVKVDEPERHDNSPHLSDLPAALPDLPSAWNQETSRIGPPPAATIDCPPEEVPEQLLRPLCLGDAIRRSMNNVQVVQANVAVRSATVARFDALRQFIPLVTLPQFMAGFNQFNSGKGLLIDFPDVMGFTQFAGLPGLNHLSASRVSLLLPLDPSGQITALPIAEEGVRAKLLMEQLVRRSQAALAIQRYFEAKQLQYGIRVARMAVDLAQETLGFTERKRLAKQAYDVEVSQARISESKTRVLLAGLEKSARIAQRELGIVLHQSRLLVPQDQGLIPIELDRGYSFDLDDPDLVDVKLVPDFPGTRDDAIQLAKRQRAEVRVLVVGLRIARLQNQRAWIRLFGSGSLPTELVFKNTTPINHGVALGAIFGGVYSPPLVDVGVWASIRQAKLDVIQSQLDLEKALIDVANDAGNAWDRWQQMKKEWVQKESELQLRHEYLKRQERLFQEKQSIRLDVLGAQLNVLQADANRWTAWYNLELAGFDVLRSTELLIDYLEKAGITSPRAAREIPPPRGWKRFQLWLTRSRSGAPPQEEDSSHGWQADDSLVGAGLRRDGGAVAEPRTGQRPAPSASNATADDRLNLTSATAGPGTVPAGAGDIATRVCGDTANTAGIPPRRNQPRRATTQWTAGDPERGPFPGGSGQANVAPPSSGNRDDR